MSAFDAILQMLRPPADPTQMASMGPGPAMPDPNAMQPAPTPPTPAMPDPSQLIGRNPLPSPIVQGVPPAAAAPVTKAHKLLQILQGGLVGGLSGMAANADTYAATGRNAGFGGGVGAGFLQSLPIMKQLQGQQVQRGGLQNKLLQNAVQFDPYQRYLEMLKGGADISKSQAEAGKFGAEAGKATAETAAIPTKTALEQAQTEAAFYKDDPNLGLIDLRTRQPVTTGGMAPLSADEAAILGKQAGDTVPLKLKNTANEMVNRGIRTVQAGGRSLLVDGKGNTIKDMGAATPVVVNNLQNAGATGTPGNPSAISRGLADGSLKWNDVVSARTPMSVKSAILAEVKSIKPDFNSGDFQVEQNARNEAVSGSVGKQLLAIGTAREHMKTFSALADALDNSDSQALNKLGNALGVQFGSDKATNLAIASQAFGGEVGRAFDGAGVIGKEREQASAAYANYLSKGQFKGAVQTVDQLLAGKQKAAHQWFDQAVQGKPDFGQTSQPQTGGPPAGATHIAPGSDHRNHYTNAQGQDLGIAP